MYTKTETKTQNGAVSLATSESARLDFFFKLTRDVVENEAFLDLLRASWAESPIDTMRILFHARDCRGGKGDRAPFLQAMAYISNAHPEWFLANFAIIPEYGRWLDLIELMATITNVEHRDAIVALLCEQLRADLASICMDGGMTSLLAKWLPTEKKKWDKATNVTTAICEELYKHRNISLDAKKRLYRKEYLSPLRAHINSVERLMCANQWTDIHFSGVPSVAMKRLRNAFAKHAPTEFTEWIDAVAKGTAKINAAQVYPHELVAHYLEGGDQLDNVIEEQWKAIVKDTKAKAALKGSLAICDVSGSMDGTPLNVSIALGMLVAATADPPFADHVITFAYMPTLQYIDPNQSLYANIHLMRNMHWGMNTNLQIVFDRILDMAVKNDAPASAMPGTLYIFSDMQFDEATCATRTNFEDIRHKYAAAGYELPRIVFWNLRSNNTKDMPVKFNDNGVALLSGYSPALLNILMDGEDITPYKILRRTIDAPRYAAVKTI